MIERKYMILRIISIIEAVYGIYLLVRINPFVFLTTFNTYIESYQAIGLSYLILQDIYPFIVVVVYIILAIIGIAGKAHKLSIIVTAVVLIFFIGYLTVMSILIGFSLGYLLIVILPIIQMIYILIIQKRNI